MIGSECSTTSEFDYGVLRDGLFLSAVLDVLALPSASLLSLLPWKHSDALKAPGVSPDRLSYLVEQPSRNLADYPTPVLLCTEQQYVLCCQLRVCRGQKRPSFPWHTWLQTGAQTRASWKLNL